MLAENQTFWTRCPPSTRWCFSGPPAAWAFPSASPASLEVKVQWKILSPRSSAELSEIQNILVRSQRCAIRKEKFFTCLDHVCFGEVHSQGQTGHPPGKRQSFNFPWWSYIASWPPKPSKFLPLSPSPVLVHHPSPLHLLFFPIVPISSLYQPTQEFWKKQFNFWQIFKTISPSGSRCKIWALHAN